MWRVLFNEPFPFSPIRSFSPRPNHQSQNASNPIPPPYDAMTIELPSFCERGPSIAFQSPTPERGYLPQINEKLGQWISWDVAQVGGQPHLPIFVCVPSKRSLSYRQDHKWADYTCLVCERMASQVLTVSG